jgi:hypothetical protein
MEDFSKYIGAAVILGITIYRAFSNYKAQQKGKSAQPVSNNQDEFELDVIDQFELEEEKTIIERKPYSNIESIPKEQFTHSLRRVEKTLVEEDEEDEQDDLVEIVEDFDARKAFIYSEILKPPYL